MSCTDHLNIYYQNVRGLRSKTNDVYLSVLANNYRIISLTETNLQPHVSSTELFPSNYIVYRKDRDLLNSGMLGGGGVLLAISNDLISQRLENLEIDLPGCDCIWVKIANVNNINIYLCVVYIKPRTSILVYQAFYDRLSRITIKDNCKIIITGDFNMQIFGSNFDLNNGDNYTKELLIFMNINNLSLKNNVCNYQNKTLDLVISNIQDVNVSRCDDPLVNEDAYHPAIVVECATGAPLSYRSRSSQNTGFAFHKADFLQLYNKVSELNWDNLYVQNNVNTAVDLFYDKLYSVIKQVCPAKHGGRLKYPPWFPPDLIKNIKLKNKFHRYFKKYGNQCDYNRFRELRAITKNDIRIAYINHVGEIENSIKADSKCFWKYIKEKRTGSNKSLVMEYNGEVLNSDKDIANAFRDYFGSVYDRYNIVPTGEMALAQPSMAGVGCLDIHTISEAQVALAIKQLKSKPTTGPDFLPQYLFKACSEYLVGPLTFLYNLSISKCVFPEKWKTTKITPIFKSGKNSLIINHRPVAVLSIPAKIFEMVINVSICDFFNKSVCVNQHGFMPGRSVSTNLINFTNYISAGLDSGTQTDAVFLDLAKAFDRVDHLTLLKKLHYYGFSDGLIHFFTSYLINRKQYVTFNGYNTSEFNVESGVPQGSNLGPTLFSIMINNISNYIVSSRALLFADDLKIFAHILSIDDIHRLQNDINSVYQWSLDNKMNFNFNKCNVMSFSRSANFLKFKYKINNIPITRVNKIKDLGVFFDCALSFNYHVDNIISSASKMMGLIFRQAAHFKNIETYKTLFGTLVRSRLECNAVVWNSIQITLEDALERVQKRFLRYLYFKNFNVYTYLVPYSELLDMFGYSSLSQRRRVHDLVFLYKLVRGGVDDSVSLGLLNLRVPNFHSRNRQLFSLPYTRTVAHSNSPLIRMMRLYNQVISKNEELDIFSDNLTTFKKGCISGMSSVVLP